MSQPQFVKPEISLSSYVAGFIISLFFTALAFSIVFGKLLGGNIMIGVLLLLAVVQAAVQLMFFMHLGTKTRWNLAMFISTAGLVLVIVVGTLWIMHHLNYNMSGQQMEMHNLQEEGISR